MEQLREIEKMTLDELRLLVLRELSLEEWPVHDWLAVEMILDRTCIRMDKSQAVTNWYSVVLMGMKPGSGIGSGQSTQPDHGDLSRLYRLPVLCEW